MKYLEINYGGSVNQITGEAWKKASAKVSVGEDEDPDVVFEEVQRRVGSWLSPNQHQPKTNEEKRQETIRGWIATIGSMATKSGLENLRPLVEKTKIPELTEAFENKIKEFQ